VDAGHIARQTSILENFKDSQETIFRREFATYFLSLGLPSSLVEDPIFQALLKHVIGGARAGIIKDSFSMSRYELQEVHLEHVFNTIQSLFNERFFSTSMTYGFEISIDGYSTKSNPKHNAIVSTESCQFLLYVTDSHGVYKDQHHISSIVIANLDRVMQLQSATSGPVRSGGATSETIDVDESDVLGAFSSVGLLHPVASSEPIDAASDSPDVANVVSHDFSRRLRGLCWVVMDGARVNLAAMDTVRLKYPHVMFGICLTHSLALLIKDIGSLSFFDKVQDVARQIIHVFRRFDIPKSLLEKVNKLVVLNFPVTRFAYFYIILERICTLRGALEEVMRSDSYGEFVKRQRTVSKRSTLLTMKDAILGLGSYASFWADCELFLEAVKPITILLRLSDQARPGFVSFAQFLFKRVVLKVIEGLKGAGARQSRVEYTSEVVLKVQELLIKREKYTFNVWHLVARALNPAIPQANQQTQLKNRFLLQNVLGEVFQTSRIQLDSELARYFARDPALSWQEASVYPPHKWWGAHSRELPLLASIAARVTSGTGVAVLTERNWSAYDFILQSRRQRLESERAFKLVSVFFNFPLLSREVSGATSDNTLSAFDEAHTEVDLLSQTEAWAVQRRQAEIVDGPEQLEEVGDEIRGFEVESSTGMSVVPSEVVTEPEGIGPTDAIHPLVEEIMGLPVPGLPLELQDAPSASESEADELCAEHRFPERPRRGKRNRGE